MTLAVKHAGTRRLTLLLAVFVLLAVFGTVHHVRTWYYERQLLQLGRGIVQEGNRTDPFPMPAEGPEADVAIKVNCSFAYLFFGPKSGKVTLIIRPRPHARETGVGGITYLYQHEGGEWRLVESSHL